MARQRMGQAAVLLLLLGCASTAAAATARHANSTAAQQAAHPAGGDEDWDEEGYRYGGKFVPNFASQPFKGKFMQFASPSCPAPYDTFSFITKIRVCRDGDGFITGIKYLSEHPTRHHDPTTVCDVVGHEGATDCETLKLYTEDWKWRRYRTVTNVRTAKVKDGRERWRVVYLAFSYSDGTGVEFGSHPHQDGAKVEQWFIKPEPGKICGMNGFFSMASICDSKSGYLQWVKPCQKCITKPRNYKCDGGDYCTRINKHKYKGGYKGDFVEDDLYKDNGYKNETSSYDKSYEEKQPYYEQPQYDTPSPYTEYNAPQAGPGYEGGSEPQDLYEQQEQYPEQQAEYEQGSYGQQQQQQAADANTDANTEAALQQPSTALLPEQLQKVLEQQQQQLLEQQKLLQQQQQQLQQQILQQKQLQHQQLPLQQPQLMQKQMPLQQQPKQQLQHQPQQQQIKQLPQQQKHPQQQQQIQQQQPQQQQQQQQQPQQPLSRHDRHDKEREERQQDRHTRQEARDHSSTTPKQQPEAKQVGSGQQQHAGQKAGGGNVLKNLFSKLG